MKKTKKLLALLMALSMVIASNSVIALAAEREPVKVDSEVEVVLYDENGQEISLATSDGQIISDLLKEVTGNEVKYEIQGRACSHIPCNSYEGYLIGHAKVSPTECWVYRMRAIICKCCGGAIKSLSGWQLQYTHAAHW